MSGYRAFLNALLILLSVSLGSCSAPGPQVTAGSLDLTARDFGRQGLASLDGPWEFFWNRAPDQVGGPGTPGYGLLEVPGYWNSEPTRSFPAEGAATYQLHLRLPAEGGPWALAVPEVSCAWKLVVDGVLVAENGVASTKPGQYRALVRPQEVLLPEGGTNRLVQLYVVNGTDRVGGIRDSVRLGPKEMVERQVRLEQADSAFFIGGLLVMAMFNLVIFFLQRQKRANLWLSVFSFFIALRSVVSGPTLILDLFPGLPFETVARTAYVGIVGAVVSFTFYLRNLFPDWWPARIFIPFLFYTGLFAILLFALPLGTYAQVFLGFYDVPLALIVFVFLGVAWVAMRKKHEDGALVFSGMIFLMVGTLNDLLYQFVPLPQGYVLGRFLFVFLVFNTFVLSRQLSKDYQLTQRQSGELRKLDKMKDDFLARVTHELRTPLNGMVGILDAFRMGDFGPLSDRQVYHLGLLEASSKRLMSMVNSILDFSQLKKQKLVSDPRPILLKQTVDFLLPAFYPHLKPGVALVNRLTDHLPAVLGDEVKLEQVLHNLVKNALQHTERGTVSVDAELRDHQVLVVVRDTGSGISSEKLAQLFSPFHQVSEIDTRQTGGLGLGLAISQQLIEQMGGTLEIQSQERVGTTVLIALPVCPPSKLQYFQAQRLDRGFAGDRSVLDAAPLGAPLTSPPADPGSADQGPVQGPMVLIVDDEPVNLLVLRSFLTRNGYQILEATSGPEALEKVSQHVVDLVILDVMMPGMSGYEVCAKVRERFTAARLPVLLLTAKNQVEDLLQGYQVGASDFLTKPFQRDELKARMELHLKVSKAARTGMVVANRS